MKKWYLSPWSFSFLLCWLLITWSSGVKNESKEREVCFSMLLCWFLIFSIDFGFINNAFLGANVPYRNLVTPAHGTPILGSGNRFVLIAKRNKKCLFENQMLLNEEEVEETETTEIEDTSFTDTTR